MVLAHGDDWPYWGVAAILGALLGAATLLSRFRYAQFRMLASWYSVLFLAVNALAALAALFLVQALGWASASTNKWALVLVTGVGALAILKTSITLQIGESPLHIGLNQIPDAFLKAITDHIAREQAVQIDHDVDLIKDVVFASAYDKLPAYCLGLVPGDTEELQAKVGKVIKKLHESDFPDAIKRDLMAVELINAVGRDVLRVGVDRLGPSIKRPQLPPACDGHVGLQPQEAAVPAIVRTDRGEN